MFVCMYVCMYMYVFVCVRASLSLSLCACLCMHCIDILPISAKALRILATACCTPRGCLRGTGGIATMAASSCGHSELVASLRRRDLCVCLCVCMHIMYVYMHACIHSHSCMHAYIHTHREAADTRPRAVPKLGEAVHDVGNGLPVESLRRSPRHRLRHMLQHLYVEIYMCAYVWVRGLTNF